MILNFNKKFIFLSNPKCGSTSIRGVLQRYNYAELTAAHLIEPLKETHKEYLANSESGAGPEEMPINLTNLMHITAHEMRTNLNLVPEPECPAWEDFYTFSTVRNPWKRMVSYYFMSEPDKNWKTIFDDLEERDVDSKFAPHFNDFCKWVIDEGRGLPSYEFFCCDWDTKERIVDDVFKLEEIDDVFIETFKAKTGVELPFDKLPDLMADFKPADRSKFNKFKGNPYDLYNQETEALIAEVYKSDIEEFNYQFGQ